jgi:carbamoyltransferase
MPAHTEPIGTRAPGPVFSEQDVKATLDSCRLTYLYEPDWGRLHDRVSRILSGGLLVAWFQGTAGFGAKAITGRAVLTDPSNRWARENVNRFFRQVPLETSLPLVAPVEDQPWCDHQVRRVTVQSVAVGAEWRNQVTGAIDRQDCVDVQGISESDDVRLHELVRGHRARTGVPALIAVPLGAPSEPVACTPRDAIRTTFSSAIDVLVIERFVLAKDHWLLGIPGR